ncbi:MAG: glycosyltransferase family 4 protein [Bdellovibrionales bacterium]|nr:glycosyltransferase family 4 protein [Bdellovibrionales bacterium]
MNIAIIAPQFPVFGRGQNQYGFIWPILKGLVQKGHSIKVFSWSSALGEGVINQDGITTYFLSDLTKNKNILNFSSLAHDEFLKEHAKEPFHVLHSLTRDGLVIARKKKKLKLAVSFDVQATDMRRLFSFIGMSEETALSKIKNGLQISYTFLKSYFKKDRELLNFADGMFVTSPQQRILLERFYLYPELKVHTVPYSVDLQDLSLRQKSEELRKKLNVPMNAKIAITVTDMLEKTEMIHILTAFQKVAIKKSNVRLIVVGHGPHFKAIEYEMLNLALPSKVIFTGALPQYEIPDYIDLADVYINLSSRSAGFESNTFEAMAQQKIVVGSDVSALANVIENGVDGYLIRPADTEALSELVLNIFSGTSSEDAVGIRAREKVLSLFDVTQLIEHTEKAYQKTIESTRRYSSHRSTDPTPGPNP